RCRVSPWPAVASSWRPWAPPSWSPPAATAGRPPPRRAPRPSAPRRQRTGAPCRVRPPRRPAPSASRCCRPTGRRTTPRCGRPGGFGAPKDLEVYLVQTDRRWEDEGFRPRFKVSNSVVLGDMGRPPQYAREWKPEEAAKLNNPPPAPPQANANGNVGEDTDF